jgi:hypothetical protein
VDTPDHWSMHVLASWLQGSTPRPYGDTQSEAGHRDKTNNERMSEVTNCAVQLSKLNDARICVVKPRYDKVGGARQDIHGTAKQNNKQKTHRASWLPGAR